ncbi:MAG: hypothetical protein ACOY4D_11310 [Pseudomonadota bacterium]
MQEAIAEYLHRKERERFMAEMITAATALAADPAAVAESLEIANDFYKADEGLDAIIEAERVAGIDHNEKWWK